MKRTRATLRVAETLIQDQDRRCWGYELSRRAKVRSGVLYPILGRMFDQGWLSDGWEDRTEAKHRPPRRYYELTDKGRRELAELVGET